MSIVETQHGHQRGIQEAFAEAELLAQLCLDSVHDALFEINKQKRATLLTKAKEFIASLESLLKEFPAINADTSEVLKHIDILEEDNYFVAQVKIRNLIGSQEYNRLMVEQLQRNDFLGKAATLRSEAAEHAILGHGDSYWGCLEKIKGAYSQHADAQGWNREDTLRLVTSVFKESADFLRKEGRHREALRHYMYYLAHARPAGKTAVERLPAFLKRASIDKDRIREAFVCIRDSEPIDGFSLIDNFLGGFGA